MFRSFLNARMLCGKRWISFPFSARLNVAIATILLIIIADFRAEAQVVPGFNYQAIVRNPSGEIMSEQPVNIGIELLQGDANGPVAFNELHVTKTDKFGLVNLRVGSIHTDLLGDISWDEGPYYIRVSVNGLPMGTSPLLSVPYAMYALKTGEPGPAGPPGEPGTSNWVDGEENVTTQVRVGIGTDTPVASLHVTHLSDGLGNVLFQGSFAGSDDHNPPIYGSGTRMMWYPAKAAFRAGRVSDTQWDKDQIGEYSAAFGLDARARGNHSFSMGRETEATGDHGVALGLYTIASGIGSTALGANSAATGFRATAMGNETVAYGDFSTAMGFKTQAMGLYSMAMGDQSVANGNAAKAWGYMNLAGGRASTAWGMDAEAAGQAATAWGVSTTAPASGATAWGNKTGATGNYSVAWGESSRAKALNSTSWGKNTNTEGDNSTAWGDNSSATATAATAWGSGNLSSASYSTSWGQNNEATGTLSTVWGIQSKATGGQSTAWGLNTLAAGVRSTAWGYETTAPSANETVLGHFSTLYIPNSQVNIVDADRLFVVGNGTSNNNRSNAFTILKNGKAGIGNVNPLTTLHVRHATIASGAQPLEGIRLENSGSGNYHWTFYVLNSTGALALYNTNWGNTPIGYFSSIDGSYIGMSSRSLKSDIEVLGNEVMRKALLLEPVSYFMRSNPSQPKMGFIAEDVLQVFPELVEVVNEEFQIMGINYSGLSVVAIKAIQEQQKTIVNLENAIASQQEIINLLMKRISLLEKEN
jgi:hypothetical protein